MSRLRTFRRNLDSDAVERAGKKPAPARKQSAHSKHIGAQVKANHQRRVYLQCTECPAFELADAGFKELPSPSAA